MSAVAVERAEFAGKVRALAVELAGLAGEFRPGDELLAAGLGNVAASLGNLAIAWEHGVEELLDQVMANAEACIGDARTVIAWARESRGR